MARKELIELCECKKADVRPISGNAANTAIALGCLRGGDTVIVNSVSAGGHISHNAIGVFGRRIQERGKSLNPKNDNFINLFTFPLTEDGYHIDVEKSLQLIDEKSPQMIVLGKSLFLFPEPVKEFYDICKEKGTLILYDAAHVFGLIIGGQFQNPLKEGATFLSASTHKTFPGPQRGIIISNIPNEYVEEKVWRQVDRGVFPGSSSNHHLYSLPALLITIREMKKWGKEYAKQIVDNAKTLGKALDTLGIPVEAKEFGYTESHQIAVNVSKFGSGVDIAFKLEESDIIVNYNMLPFDTDPKNPSGLRIGVSEMTRYGMKEKDFEMLAELIAEVIKEKKNVKTKVNEFRQSFLEVQYSLQDSL